MKVRSKAGRVPKSEWLEVALELLEAGGINAVRVEQISQQIGVARSSFYWHFKDRQNLLEAMLEYWVSEYTTQVIKIVNAETSNKHNSASAVLKIAEVVDQLNMARYDLPIREWALHDQKARKAVLEANRLRLEFVRSKFADMGFTGDELEMRTRLFVCYHTWEKAMFSDLPKSKRARLRKLRLDLLTSSKS